MATINKYHYTYYSYEEWGRGYIGSRTCNYLPEEDVDYFGSFKDKTFKPTQKIILKSDYATREEAYADEIILHDYYDVANNPHFANRSNITTTKFSPSKEKSIETGRICGLKLKELSAGIFSRSKEQLIKDSRKGGKKSHDLKMGIHSRTKEQMSKDGKKGALTNKNNNSGIFSLSKEQLRENGKRGVDKLRELGVGIFAMTEEQRRKNGKITCSQKWQCLETGFITNPGNLTKYQNKRGINTSKRIRLS
jgi:hypothetical protein